MDPKNITSTATVGRGRVAVDPKTTTNARRLENGNMVVEVTTVFEVEDPDEVFSLNSSGISMTVETVN